MDSKVQNHQAYKNRVSLRQKHSNFRTKKEKEERKNSSILSNFSQQLARPVPAAGVDLRPLVEGGRSWSKHDQVFLLQAQPAHTRGGDVAAGP